MANIPITIYSIIGGRTVGLCGLYGSLYTILAYLDPGTGSYIFQIMIATLLGIAVTAKTWWKKLTGYINKNRRS